MAEIVRPPGRFSSIAYDNQGVEKAAALKGKFEELETVVNQQLQECPETARAKALVMTCLEEAHMWCNKAVRDDQVRRSRSRTEEVIG